MLNYQRLLLLLIATASARAADVPFGKTVAPLRDYAGTWRVVRNNAGVEAKPEELKNECALVGRFFACQQTINGAVGGLLVIVPSNSPGHYATQNVDPSGRARGLGQLQIEGGKWTLLSTWNQGAKTIRYRTANTFSGRNRIHFEQEESEDGRNWKVTGSGDQTRIK